MLLKVLNNQCLMFEGEFVAAVVLGRQEGEAHGMVGLQDGQDAFQRPPPGLSGTQG
jgi:hypothetical protein